jgi:hypothetical protein
MASYLRSLNLDNGVEEVNTNFSLAGNILNGDVIFLTDYIETKSVQILNSSESQYIDITYSDNSTQDLTLTIENTKSTLEDGDILVYNETNSTFKVDNISNYVSGGGGNTYTISLPFSKGGGNINGTVTIPTNAVLLGLWITIIDELSTGGAPFTIRLDGSSPLVLATQGSEFSETVGTQVVLNDYNAIALGAVSSSNSGVLQANHSGSGYGSGIIYLQYSTELS